MGLEKAHEGYEYQDLFTAFFILKEILAENESEFNVDKKEFGDDRIDDLMIKNNAGRRKVQVKYSGDSNHTFQKGDIAGDNAYGLALDRLYQNWNAYTDKISTTFRLCLAWNAPTDNLTDFIEPFTGAGSFTGYATKCFKIKGESIWPDGDILPVTSWRRFKDKAKEIDRTSFLEFCNQLIIETELPKFSLSLDKPGTLEELVIQQVHKLGIGVFPNENTKPDHFILKLTAMIKRARSKGIILSTKEIFHDLNIRTDYGTIEQNFPVVAKENVKRNNAIEKIISETKIHGKIMLVGEPGSGKSWLIQDLQKVLQKEGIKTIRHYCYTKLDDLLQRQRIQLNIFFGNLIHDILQAFPELKHVKQAKYASSLSELNLLLKNIPSPTFIIIDGLDHIERIFAFRSYREIDRQDIAIIETLEKLAICPNVKLVVASQNIPQLRYIPSFHKISVSAWSEEDVKVMMRKMRVNNSKLKAGISLSKILLDKSAGNPLYLRYLFEEIKKSSGDVPDLLKPLPAYSFNLSKYYNDLLSKLNLREDVPQVLSGINFSVTKTELEEITHSGAHVAESLEVLSPVLKDNFSQSGYVIYHESFRRFIIDRLRSSSVSIDKKVFDPVIEWFGSKDFFSHRKAFRYFLPFLFESEKFDKMLRNLTKTFVTDSVINGQPWELIERNFVYLVKAASYEKDFPKIILLNEIDKVLATTEQILEENFTLYFEALGRVNGFEYVSEYLLFEGEPALDTAQGLRACYTCDRNDIVAPWKPYIDLLKGKPLEPEDYRYFIRGLLVLGEDKKLNKMVSKAIKYADATFTGLAREELLYYKNTVYIKSLVRKYPALKKITRSPKKSAISKQELLGIALEILRFESSFRNETIVLEKFFDGFRAHARDKNLLDQLRDLFKGRNWFYNWIIYWLRVISMKARKKITYKEVKESFEYLRYSMDPFLGKPRVCDLYSVQYLTYESFREGLMLVETGEQWKEIIDLLTEVGNETTTSIQKSASGPLETARLFSLLGEFLSDINREYINEVFEALTKEREEYRLHEDIAEYKLRLSCLFSLANDLPKAKANFNEGIACMFAYTMRKDLTLVDVIQGVEWMADFDKPIAIEDLKFSKVLIDSAIDHTDGKETNYFPIEWFEGFLRIDFHLAGIYLLDLLKQYPYYWIAERSLANLLSEAGGLVNPLVEYYLALSFPCNDSEKFVSYCLGLCDILKNKYPEYSEKLMARVASLTVQSHDNSFSDMTKERYNKAIANNGKPLIVRNEERILPQANQKWYEAIAERKEFPDMSPDELRDYFEENGIRSNELNSLCLYFDQYSTPDEGLKELIQTIARKSSRLVANDIDPNIIFNTGTEVECYYRVCRFFFDRGGWFERFVNQKAFTRACEINRDKAIEFLFELMPVGLQIQFNFSFSSNLIKALINNNHAKDEIKDMWNALLDMTSYRLPFKDVIDWAPILADDLEMSDEEIMICMLLTRFKGATSERFRNATLGIKDILEKCPEKFERPLKWFIRHRVKFLQPAFCIVLQLFSEHSLKDASYPVMFEKELTSIYPTHYFLIDLVISRLYHLDIANIQLPRGIVYPPMSPGEFDWFIRLNRRFNVMKRRGIDLESVFRKHKCNFQRKYEDSFDLYQNRVYKQWALHIFASDNLLELINVDLYNELTQWQREDDNDDLTYPCLIDTNAMVAYGKCFTFRPDDLTKPSDLTSEYDTVEMLSQSEWIRLAHYERELKDERALRMKPLRSYGGIIFSDKKVVLPYSSYNIFPHILWTDSGFYFEIDPEIVFAIFQDEPLEFYKILWLNPTILTSLRLVTKIVDCGLVAVNEQGETILRMRTWWTNYLGSHLHSQLSQEIPKFEGTELIIRKDYFRRICEMFRNSPRYVTVKVEEGLIREGEDE